MKKILFMLVACVLCACQGNNNSAGGSDFALDFLQYNASGAGDSFDIKVTANGEWSATSDKSWATITPAEGAGSATVKVETEPNEKEVSDVAILTFTPKSGKALEFKVNREATSSSLVITPASKTFTPNGGSFTAKVKAEGEWSVKCNAEWLSLDVTGGEGNGEIKITAGKNETIAERQAEIEFTAGEETAIMNITQVTNTRFARSSFLVKFTGTWCANCPTLTAALDEILEEDPNAFVEIALHGDEEKMGDAVELQTPMTTKYADFLKPGGYPCVFVDNNTDLFSSSLGEVGKTVEDVKKKLDLATKTNPAVVGIKLSTEVTADNKIKVRVETTVQKFGPYKIICAHTKSGYNYPQVGTDDPDNRQNHVFRSFLQEDPFGDKLAENSCEAGDVIVTEYETEVIDADNLEQEQIVVGILNRTVSGDYFVNNAAGCKVGESVDYRFL